jgi:ubiquinol-cytochrome c reductase iron-sulfur subunit
MAAAGAVLTTWPLVDQMNPDAGTLAQGGPVDVDLSTIGPGQQVIARWQSRPIFVSNRSPSTLSALQDKTLIAELSDPASREHQQPAYADNWHRSIDPRYGVFVGICTHLGCIPQFRPDTDPSSGWFGGYFCPCHGSKYDLAGRVFKGVPAPYNLPVPACRIVNGATLRIGENPPGQSFSLDEVAQI